MYKRPIIAVDFDRTLGVDVPWEGVGVFPPIREDGKEALALLRDCGCEVVIHTNRRESERHRLADYLRAQDVEFNDINRDSPQIYPNLREDGPETRKMAADFYIDDHAIKFTSWAEVLSKLVAAGVLRDQPLEDRLGIAERHLYDDYKVVAAMTVKFGHQLSTEEGRNQATFLYNAIPDVINIITFLHFRDSAFISFPTSWLSTMELDEFARAKTLELLHSISGHFASFEVREKARTNYLLKNQARGSCFLDGGVTAALNACFTKLSRLRFDPADADSIVDLFNYIIFARMCACRKLFVPSPAE